MALILKGNRFQKLTGKKREDDSIQTRTFIVVRRTKRWLRKLKYKEGPHMSSHESRIDSHIVVQSPISATNEIVDVAGVSKPIVNKIPPRRSRRSPSSLTVA